MRIDYLCMCRFMEESIKGMVDKEWVASLLWMLQQMLFISILTLPVQGHWLPGNVIPNSYNIELMTDFPKNEIKGKETIKIQCVDSTSEIILHSKDLEIFEADVTLKQLNEGNKSLPKDIPINSQKYDEEKDFYIIKLDQKLVPGNLYYLYISFKGKMNENGDGYYMDSYPNNAPKESLIYSATYFLPNNARRAFPCFDEPNLKATFKISLGHHDTFKAISTMPIEKTEPIYHWSQNEENWVIDHFHQTPVMSTHVVGFVLSKFDVIQVSLKDSNTQLRIWARKEVLSQTEFAKEISPKLISYFESLLGVEFPLPKLDLVALPGWNSHTFESWGLITIREFSFLDNGEVSDYVRHRIATTISRKLVHQWFGNLVTWRNDNWLIEGFAEYIGYHGVHYLFPEWNSLERIFSVNYSIVLKMDELEYSQFIWRTTENPSKIQHDFDHSTYQKASLLFRMIKNILGQKIFFTSISNYLNKYKYSNSSSEDLWDMLTNVAQAQDVLPSNISMKMIMDTWTLQNGYPLLTVTRDYVRNKVAITQKRCLAEKIKRRCPHLLKTCWWIPLTYTISINVNNNHDTKHKSWLTCEGPLTINLNASADQWLLLNIEASVVSRVNYDKRNWELLQYTLLDKNEYIKIDRMSRFQLILDSMYLAWYGSLDYQVAFDLIAYIQHETKYAPLMAGFEKLNEIRAMILNKPIYEQFKKFMNDILKPHFKQCNVMCKPNNHVKGQLHYEIIKWSCYYGVLDCKKQYIDLFKAWFNHKNPDQNNPIPQVLKLTSYCEAVYDMGKEAWDFLWQRYQNSNNDQDKEIILSGMGCIQDEALINVYLRWSIDSSNKFVDTHNMSLEMFDRILKTKKGYLLAKSFLMENFQQFVKRYHTKGDNLGWYIVQVFTQLSSYEELEEFEAFLSSVSEYLTGAEQSINKGREIAEDHLTWYQMNYDKVEQYFLSKQDSSALPSRIYE